MLREIKFRIWDSKEMYDTETLDLIGDMASPYRTLDDESEFIPYGNNEKGKLMQFTGLKDKNNKEIYEGDILKANKKWFKLGNDVGIVGFHKGQYCVRDDEWDNTDYITNRKVEVIGNIYENPELLNQEKHA